MKGLVLIHFNFFFIAYGAQCAWSMQNLRRQFPHQFWADPNEFFSDGPLLNFGSDFGLMPSLFEPSGVVQQEFFVGGTPVIAFKTGGLRDSVFEFDSVTRKGNGFTFEAHTHSDFIQAITRALIVFYNREDLQQLRKNCTESVWDVINVATGWANEFARLRKVMWAPSKDIEGAKLKLQQQQQQKSSSSSSDETTPKT